jgi:aromatic ring-cleaving dioxygenase
MNTPTEPALSTQRIRSYHAHVYFRDADERVRALAVREAIAERFLVQLGRVHDALIGPHNAPMYQIAFGHELFSRLLPWLLLNRSGLSVLVHPNTGRARDDHVLHALWLGTALGVRADVLSNVLTHGDGARIEPNTSPRLDDEEAALFAHELASPRLGTG